MSALDWLRAWLSGARASATPAVLPRPIMRYPRGVCQACGLTDVALRGDGLPHARRHRCGAAPRPVVTAADVAAVAADFAVVGRDLVTATETVYRVPQAHPIPGGRPMCGRCRGDLDACACGHEPAQSEVA